MPINNDKEYLRQKNYHLPRIDFDENALIMICERDEKPQPSATACWKINMACHAAKLRTHALNNKKQAFKGLMKIANDMR